MAARARHGVGLRDQQRRSGHLSSCVSDPSVLPLPYRYKHTCHTHTHTHTHTQALTHINITNTPRRRARSNLLRYLTNHTLKPTAPHRDSKHTHRHTHTHTHTLSSII